MKTLSQTLLALKLEEEFHEQTKGRADMGWEEVSKGEENLYYGNICNSDNKNKVKKMKYKVKKSLAEGKKRLLKLKGKDTESPLEFLERNHFSRTFILVQCDTSHSSIITIEL